MLTSGPQGFAVVTVTPVTMLTCSAYGRITALTHVDQQPGVAIDPIHPWRSCTADYAGGPVAALRVSDELIASTETAHVAWRRPDAPAGERGAWVVSWLPLRLLTREQALAAMMLAEAVGRGIRPDDHQRVESWAHELGLTGSEVIAQLRE